ncbi:MAG TPA: leucine--tRNA ligase [Candidatus Nanoarchaeia archaeon]|nr:leucine--tRNA ligase [Candidatus Nanoarchaeia archaeon]
MVNFKQIETKWQKEWEKQKAFKVKEDSKKKKFYCIEMFPYPSSTGLHMGHALNYIIGDIFARFKRMQEFNVLYPMGYDAFGLPAENAAIKAGEHPASYTEKAIKNFILQQKALGLSYDWDKKLTTSEPEYYKWNQYFFLKFYEAGLVYRKNSAVNWCPKCQTVLANEQVHSGKCWRHEDTNVEIKQLEQWFIKTTKYADELLNKINDLDWPEKIKTMQENWIGESYGTEILFEINGKSWPVFTTRPDTIYGVTFMAISAQHPKLMELVTKKHKKEVEEFLKRLKSVSEKELEAMGKEGVLTGSYAINPLTKEKLPVYAGNFVVADYGSGIVMAVPAHDQRDFEFAKKYKIPIKIVMQPNNKKIDVNSMKEAYTEEGVLINSDKFNGINSKDAKDKITKKLETKGIGKKTVKYKLRDWLVSRQRYWGTPIPIIYCEKCGIVPVSKNDLPILLPKNVKFGEGNPLASSKEFVNVKCSKCKSNARRETDTMDTFFDSSWYYLRYFDNKNNKKPFDQKKAEYWMPVDKYIGGAEHACMHLIYARFFTKALRDLKFLKFDEPFTSLFNQGLLHGNDGNKMSKSLGNVINPIDMIEKYSADSLRFTLMSLASPDKDSVWNDITLESNHKWLIRFYNFCSNAKLGKSSPRTEHKINKTIKETTEEIQNFRYNIAIIKLRTLLDNLEKEEKVSREDLENYLKLLHPICPHITEELWHKLGNKTLISLEKWPKYNEKKINTELEQAETLVENIKDDIREVMKILNKQTFSSLNIIISPKWKYELYNEFNKAFSKSKNPSEITKEIMKTELKKYGQEIIKIIPKLIEKQPENSLTQEKELRIFNDYKKEIEKEFSAKITIEKAEESKEQKAKNANPGKPAIILE